MLFNAVMVLKDRKLQSSKILGRVFIRDLKEVPSEWLVEYREEYISKETDIGSLMCSQDEPIHLIGFSPTPGTSKQSTSSADKPSVFHAEDGDEHIIDLTGDSDEDIQVEKVLPVRFKESTRKPYKSRMRQAPSSDSEEEEAPKRQTRSAGPAPTMDELMSERQRILRPLQALRRLKLTNHPAPIWEPRDPKSKKRVYRPGTVALRAIYRGPTLSTVDLQSRQVKRKGVFKTNSWEIYDIGMNLYGTCSNASCISKLTVSKEVVVKMNYGRIAMTKMANKFECTACKIEPEERERFFSRRKKSSNKWNGEVGTFTPSSFLLTYGRTLYRFKKIGVNEPIKTVLMESMGLPEVYKTFDDTSKKSEAEYDFIEITTVGKKSSPFVCAHCNRRIREKEVNLVCGHALHPTCQHENKPGFEKCPVCTSKLYENLRDVPGTSRSGSEAYEELERSGTKNLKLPSDWNRERGEGNTEAGIVDKWNLEMEESERLLQDE